MDARDGEPADSPGRKPAAGTNRIWEVSYLDRDESEALAARARVERCSKAEISRRALRAYLQSYR